MKLCVKTGMTSEYDLVKKYIAPDVQLLTGAFTPAQLEAEVDKDCEGIISVGLCGGLSPLAVVGQVLIYGAVATPDGVCPLNAQWIARLYAPTRYFIRNCWSSGLFNTANTTTARDALYNATGCWLIDDETYAVAEFAAKRNIACAGLRSVSDGEHDNLPPAVMDALKADGSTDLWAVIESVVAHPSQIPALFKTALEFKKSLDTLAIACRQVGPHFQFQ